MVISGIITGPVEPLWLLRPRPDQNEILLEFYSHTYCAICARIKVQKAETMASP